MLRGIYDVPKDVKATTRAPPNIIDLDVFRFTMTSLSSYLNSYVHL